MQIIITGGAGFLGQRLAKALLKNAVDFEVLVLADIILPANPSNDSRVKCQQVDLSKEGAAKNLITSRSAIVFHLAAVVSSQAEKEFDLGYTVNLDITRVLLEACRHHNSQIKFIFSSSLAVYGGTLPALVTDMTAVTPRSSYGTQKAMGELLVNDYSRKGFVDGRVLRLPTICVRPGHPNLAASSFVSSIIREPLNGEQAVCPVSTDLALWLSSPDTIIENIIKAAVFNAAAFEGWRTVNLPGIGVTVREMLASLERITGKEAVDRVKFIPDESINKIVSSWPGAIDNSRAIEMGFKADNCFEDFITQFITTNK
ncbi:MAG: D-erythronate dehydrogenase [Segetibacter sp.]